MLIFRNIKGRNVPLIRARNQRVYNHQISFWDKQACLWECFRISHRMVRRPIIMVMVIYFAKFNANQKASYRTGSPENAYRNIPNYNHGAINLTTKENQILEKVETLLKSKYDNICNDTKYEPS